MTSLTAEKKDTLPITTTDSCVPRLIAGRCVDDLAQHLRALGVPPDPASLLARHLYYRPVKLERVALEAAMSIREIMQRIGGKAVLSSTGSGEHDLVDVLLVANVSCLTAFVAELKKQTGLLPEVAKQIEDVVVSLADRKSGASRLEVKGKVFDFSSQTYIMGILNVTPDSFSDGGVFFDRQKAIEQAHRMVDDGADILDIGGESTRPDAEPVSAEEELRRIMPVIEAVAHKVDAVLSVDTTKARVAEQALAAGVDIINDVSGLRFDPALGAVAARSGAPVVLMHMLGTPRTMQKNIHYKDTLSEILAFLRERIAAAEQAGIRRNRIIIDPGIGFGKTLDRDNLLILKNLEELASLGRPILVGPSRKAFLGKILDLPVDDRVEATAAAVAVAVMNGANIVRVHDVKPIKRVVKVVDAIKRVAPREAEAGR